MNLHDRSPCKTKDGVWEEMLIGEKDGIYCYAELFTDSIAGMTASFAPARLEQLFENTAIKKLMLNLSFLPAADRSTLSEKYSIPLGSFNLIS